MLYDYTGDWMSCVNDVVCRPSFRQRNHATAHSTAHNKFTTGKFVAVFFRG